MGQIFELGLHFRTNCLKRVKILKKCLPWIIDTGCSMRALALAILLQIKDKQDGPSLESSSYLNVTLRYLDPWDPVTLRSMDLGILGPWDSWTSSLLHHLPILPLNFSYLLLLLSSFGMVWHGGEQGGWVLTLGIEIDNWRWTFDLYIDVEKLWGGGWWCTLDSSINSGPLFELWDWKWTRTRAWQW